MTYRLSKSVQWCRLRASRRIKQKRVYRTNHNRRFFTCSPTPPTLSQRHRFACVGIPTTWFYIQSFIEIRSRISKRQGVQICLFPLLRLLAFTTACNKCSTIQAVICMLLQVDEEETEEIGASTRRYQNRLGID